jgi:hypothetical protein
MPATLSECISASNESVRSDADTMNIKRSQENCFNAIVKQMKLVTIEFIPKAPQSFGLINLNGFQEKRNYFGNLP